MPYRPDFVWDGRPGWFRNPCHGETYDMAGQRVFGPSPRDLDRLALEIRDGAVYVNPNAITRGPIPPTRDPASITPAPPPPTPAPTPPTPEPSEDYEFETGGTLLPQRWLRRD